MQWSMNVFTQVSDVFHVLLAAYDLWASIHKWIFLCCMKKKMKFHSMAYIIKCCDCTTTYNLIRDINHRLNAASAKFIWIANSDDLTPSHHCCFDTANGRQSTLQTQPLVERLSKGWIMVGIQLLPVRSMLSAMHSIYLAFDYIRSPILRYNRHLRMRAPHTQPECSATRQWKNNNNICPLQCTQSNVCAQSTHTIVNTHK